MKIQLYDTTLRDGAQQEGISFSVEDKIKIARKLDELGIHFIEGGWPGSNPKDTEFFQRLRQMKFVKSIPVAFGSTRRPKSQAENDNNLKGLLEAKTKVATLVGKGSSEQVKKVLKTSLDENLEMVADSRRLDFAFLAGSSLPVTRRMPALDIKAQLSQFHGIVEVTAVEDHRST